MGLDMYAHAVYKIHPDMIKAYSGKSRDKLPDGWLIISKDDLESDECKELKPFMSEITVITKYYDMKKIYKELHIPDDWEITGESYGREGIHMTFRPPHETKNPVHDKIEFSASEDEIKKNYTVDRTETCFACEEDEIGYWRKNFELERKIYDAYPGSILNCGYHHANKRMLRLMIEAGANADETDNNVFYTEWY